MDVSVKVLVASQEHMGGRAMGKEMKMVKGFLKVAKA